MSQCSEASLGKQAAGILQQLIRIRHERQLRQADVARKMGMSRQQVNNLESMRQGFPSILTIERYARAVQARLVVVKK